MFVVRRRRDIAFYSALITAIAVGTTGTFVHFATHHFLHGPAYRYVMLFSTGLPLVITPPIAMVSLAMLRFMTLGLDKIENFVKFDALTAVLSRSYFMESLRQRFGEGGAFMLVDADHFKKINDGFGHDVGDEALRTIGRVMNDVVPHDALIGRMGGEEFGVFLPGVLPSLAESVAEKLCASMTIEGRMIAGNDVGLTVSIGIAMIDRGSSLSLIFKEADESLYSAKASGRNKYVFSRKAANNQRVEFRKVG